MENKQSASQLTFSIDLLSQVSRHIAFLEAVAGVPYLKDENVLTRAVYRYETYWLPLAAEHLDECLAAPLDIEWIWHCHMLSPKNYENDCLSLVGKVVNHTFYSQEQRGQCLQISKNHWLQKYGDKDEPFTVDFKTRDIVAIENFTSSLSYDLVAAAMRQSTFYDTVSSTEYKNEDDRYNFLESYKQYIYLCKLLPSHRFTPNIEIDLLWHTHQANPLSYKSDMGRILRRLLKHDDTSTDLAQLDEAYQLTKITWERLYNEPCFGECFCDNEGIHRSKCGEVKCGSK